MITIHKYPITPGACLVSMPQGAKLLTVQMQHKEPMLWAIVDTFQPKVYRRLHVAGTGHDCSRRMQHWSYVATFQMDWMVWHVFDGGEGSYL